MDSKLRLASRVAEQVKLISRSLFHLHCFCYFISADFISFVHLYILFSLSGLPSFRLVLSLSSFLLLSPYFSLSLCRSLALSKSSSHPLLCLPFFPSFFLISYSSFFLSSFDSLNSPLLCIYDKLQAHDLKLYRNTDQMELATKAGAR